jgi:uncharacterized OB-fold protein
MTYEKPLPAIDGESQPFWQAAREHRLAIMRCRDCGKHFFYPRELCPFCHRAAVEWANASGRGRIYTFTIARRPAGPVFKADVPYVIALVELEEGPRLMTNIVTKEVDRIRIGQAVKAVFDDVTADVTLVKFAPT